MKRTCNVIAIILIYLKYMNNYGILKSFSCRLNGSAGYYISTSTKISKEKK